MKIVVFSDTHGLHNAVHIPDGDMLIFAGDMCNHGTLHEVIQFDQLLAQCDHPYKIVIAGNHDFPFQNTPDVARACLQHGIYLQDSTVEIEGLKIYGSPWQPWFLDWAFNLRRGEELRQKWDLIPNDIDILITHGPPFGILDRVGKNSQGCEDLLQALQRVNPRYHIFGHIHEAYGQYEVNKTVFVNSSICNARYQPINPVQLYEL